jgi:methyl-accepting chemotaxis protein WspA
MTIRWKLVLGALAFLVLFVAVYVATSLVTRNQRSDGLVINLAGRQRALSEKMTKELLAYADRPGDDPWQTFEASKSLFLRTQVALLDGGTTEDTNQQEVGLPRSDDADVRDALGVVVDLSTRFFAAADKVRVDAKTAAQAASEVVRQTPVLIARVDAATARARAAIDEEGLDADQRAQWATVLGYLTRQPLLAQRASTLALDYLRLPTEAGKKELEAILQVFDGTQAALRSGGPVLRKLEDPSDFELISAAPSARVQERLLDVDEEWLTFRRSIGALTDAAVTKAEALTEAGTLTPSMRKGMNRVVSLKQDLAERRVGRVEAVQLAALVLGVVFVIVAAFVGARIGSHLTTAVGAARTIAAGDLTHRNAIPSSDETGQLLDSLNGMTEQLAHLVRQVQASGTRVGTSSSQIASSARRQEATVSELASTATQIAATSTEIAATAEQLRETMNQVGQVAEGTARAAANSKRGLEDMQRTMAHMVQGAETVTERLAAISQRTTRIASIVGTIMKIAQQTNLISLNAAIEAENAGELGLGFAVVAKEVRRLADQTTKASADVEQMIAEMQSSVSTAVMGMDGFSEDIRGGSQAVQEVVARLGRIIDAVADVTPRFASVRDGMSAQAEGAGQIAEGVRQIVDSSEETAASVRQTNAAIAELMKAAGTLQEGVQRFKVGAAGGANGR